MIQIKFDRLEPGVIFRAELNWWGGSIGVSLMGRARRSMQDRGIRDPVRPTPLLWSAAIVLATVHAWISRYAMNEDGISYLDMGDAFMRGDWQVAVNGHWSPLYSWLTGLALLLFRPSPRWEFPVVHLINFLVFLFALAAFSFLVRELIACRRQRSSKRPANGRITFPDWAWSAAGYGLFIWSSLHLIGVELVSPDLLLSGFVYLATGLLLRVARHPERRRAFALLGLVLGLGYLAKAPLFPLSGVYLAVAVVLVGDLTKALLRVALSLAVFLAVAGPYVAALSRKTGHLTFGESARLNWAWHVDHSIPYVHWQGDDPLGGTPVHPTRKILADPAVYEFASPIGGTYPPWYDPAYWNEGVALHFDLRAIATTFAYMARYWLFKLLIGPVQLGLIAGLLAAWLAGGGRRSTVHLDKAIHASTIVPAIAALLMFSLVHLSVRYVAAFIVILWLGILSAVQLPSSDDARRILRLGSVIMAVLVWIAVGDLTVRRIYETGDSASARPAGRNSPLRVAEGLREMGLRPGEPVGCIGSGLKASYWARLARVRIVAELPPPQGQSKNQDSGWSADYPEDAKVVRAFARAGVTAIIAKDVPNRLSASGWQRIGRTDHYALFLDRFVPGR